MLNGKMLDGQVCPFNNETEIKKPGNRHTQTQFIFGKSIHKGNLVKEVLYFQQMFLEQWSIHVQKRKKKKRTFTHASYCVQKLTQNKSLA